MKGTFPATKSVFSLLFLVSSIWYLAIRADKLDHKEKSSILELLEILSYNIVVASLGLESIEGKVNLIHLLNSDWSIFFAFWAEGLYIINNLKLGFIFDESKFRSSKPDSKIFNVGVSPHNELNFSEIWVFAISIPSKAIHFPFLIPVINSESWWVNLFNGDCNIDKIFLAFSYSFFSSFVNLFDFNLLFIFALNSVKSSEFISSIFLSFIFNNFNIFSNFSFSSLSNSSFITDCPVNNDNPEFAFNWYTLKSCPKISDNNFIIKDFPEAVTPWIIGVFFAITQHNKNKKHNFSVNVIELNFFFNLTVSILSGYLIAIFNWLILSPFLEELNVKNLFFFS